MRLTKFLKRVAIASLAVVVAVTAIPYQSSVKAASDEYPEEVYFPVQVLDFRRDDLLFEWYNSNNSNNYYYHLGLYESFTTHGGRGKGLVEEELGPDGTPVYTEEALREIAVRVQRNLQDNIGPTTNSILKWSTGSTSGAYHDLSLKKYVQKRVASTTGSDVHILSTSLNASAISSDIKWVPDDADTVSYTMTKYSSATSVTYGGVTYDEVYAEVFASGETTPTYLLRKTGITLLANKSVSQTFSGLDGSYNVSSLWRGDGTGSSIDDSYTGKIQILVNDIPIEKDSIVRPDADGNIKVTIKVAESVTDVAAEALDQLAVGDIKLKSISGYPLGDVDQSKAKFDKNPDLGWTHITTCYDYAYFVTSNFFKYNASLNTQYNDYDNLIFHKVDEDGKIYYEFAADQNHTNANKYNLIYNSTDKTIRNKQGVAADSRLGEEEKPAGSMFIVDGAERQYPDQDKFYSASDGRKHNFHFTITSHSRFVYKSGKNQTFHFTGDDDVYVFLNGHLVMDLGGAHSPASASINLDTIAASQASLPEEERWLVDGEVVSLDFFYMERHSTQSNFYAKLNFKLATDMVGFDMEYDAIPYGYLVDLDYTFETLRELNSNTNITFKDNLGNIIGADGFTLGEGVSLKDNKLVVTVTDADGNVDPARSREFEFVDPSSPTAAEINAVKEYFQNLKVTLKEVVKITGPQFDTSSKPYDDYDDVAGESVNTKSLDFMQEVTYEAWMDGATVPTEGYANANTPVKVLTGSIKVCAAQEDNEKKDLADYGLFTIDRDTSSESVYSGEFHYENNPDEVDITEKTFEKMSRGKYTLKLDTSVLTSYKVTINDEEVTELTIDFEPEYDPESKTWIYPDVKFELRAKRIAPDLKDLT